MIIYEVEIQVDRAIREEYESWLMDHIRKILSLPYFIKPDCLEQVDGQSGSLTYVVRYASPSIDNLNLYLTDHAPAFRAEAEQRFAGQFKARRRVLELKNTFGGE